MLYFSSRKHNNILVASTNTLEFYVFFILISDIFSNQRSSLSKISSLDIHEYEQAELMATSTVWAQKGNSMKMSQLSNIVDQTTDYSSFSTNFNASQLKNSWTDKSQDYFAIPWVLYSSSSVGMTGTEMAAWRDTPLALIKNSTEQGLDEATVNFNQENNVHQQRSIRLVQQVTASALSSTLEEIGLNIDDAPYPASTGGYAVNQNSALVDREQFFQSTSQYYPGAPYVGAPSTGYYSGIAYIRAKYISDWRWKAGIKKYGFTWHLDFNGLNGTQFPLLCRTQHHYWSSPRSAHRFPSTGFHCLLVQAY